MMMYDAVSVVSSALNEAVKDERWKWPNITANSSNYPQSILHEYYRQVGRQKFNLC